MFGLIDGIYSWSTDYTTTWTTTATTSQATTTSWTTSQATTTSWTTSRATTTSWTTSWTTSYSSTVTEGPYYTGNYYTSAYGWYSISNAQTIGRWNGSNAFVYTVANSDNVTSRYVAPYTYYRGTYRGITSSGYDTIKSWEIYRTYVASGSRSTSVVTSIATTTSWTTSQSTTTSWTTSGSTTTSWNTSASTSAVTSRTTDYYT